MREGLFRRAASVRRGRIVALAAVGAVALLTALASSSWATGRAGPQRGGTSEAPRHERHLQSRHHERLLHGAQHHLAWVHAAARVLPVLAELPGGNPAGAGRRRCRPDTRKRRHQRRREDVHLPHPPRREVGHGPAPPGQRGGFRPRVQDALQPGFPDRSARLLHQHDRRHGVLLRRLRQSQGNRARNRPIRRLPPAAGRRRDRSAHARLPPDQPRAGLSEHPRYALLLGTTVRVHEVRARQRRLPPAHDL